MASGDGENYEDNSSGFFADDLDQHDTERDLYAILHINKDADAVTIQQAYRRLTLLYHPDKHVEPRNKQLAMDLFIQVKKAYDILNDPQKRAIYDVVGTKGLKAEGWEVNRISLQWKTGADSCMKGGLHYDNQTLSVSSAIQLGFVNTYGAIDGVYRFPDICNLRCSLKLFVFGPWFEYGIDRQLTKYTHGSATVAVSSRMGVSLRLKFTRGSQAFTFPLQISQDIVPSTIFYATVAPTLAYLVLDRLIIRPFARSEQEKEQKKREDEAREKQAERRREAINAQEVLRSLVDQIKDREGLEGLIILEARYGQLGLTTTNENSIKIIDVTVPLQVLVKDSTLKIATTVSKSNLTGFYDPCIGEEKSLFIKYSLRSQIHTILYKDTDPVILPNRGNQIYLFLSNQIE
ncbi:unnamed protein product [Rotaria magnacalcarata]|uniref:J domain-containing protein n=1 Tax=Rotaria magnacalcarata TaxID=392030 RepID=A0A8S2LHG2_9BILA|nr:unnamed protein product [Rotaria magnacalcarata]